MGYFAVGFAFNQEPRWDALQRLLPDYRMRGYLHKGSSLYLLDVWEAQVESKREHWPFTGELNRAGDLGAALDAIASPVADAFDDVIDAFGFDYLYPPAWMKIAPAFARAAGTETFFFRANDDEYHYACLALPDAAGEPIAGLACRVDLLRLTVAGGKLVCQLYEPEDLGDTEDGEEDDKLSDADLAAALDSIDGAVAGPRLPGEDGFIIYQELLDLWPKAWGDCEALLGWGTFDPFTELDRHFEVVFGGNG